jgi:hypothetical protein
MKIVSGDTEMDQFQQRFFIIVTTMTVLASVASWIVVALTFVAAVAAFILLTGTKLLLKP